VLAGVVVSTAVAALQWLGPSVPASKAADLNPYQEAKQMVYGPTADGSIQGCPSNVNPNCVSTGKASARVFNYEVSGGSIANQQMHAQ
jgi:hypothetical protein